MSNFLHKVNFNYYNKDKIIKISLTKNNIVSNKVRNADSENMNFFIGCYCSAERK